MNNTSEFSKSKYNSSPTKSSETNPHATDPQGARPGTTPSKSRGVEHPIPEDQALIGDTRHELHSKALPRSGGPNFGYGSKAPSDEFRADTGEGAACL